MPREVDVSTSIEIACPRAAVAAFAMQPDNAPEWYVNIHRARWVSAPALEPGARVAFDAEFLGRSLSYIYTIAELVRDERLVMRTDAPFAMETTYCFEPAGSGTRVTLRNRGRPAGFARWLSPLIAFAMRRANQRDLRRLKRVLEDGAPAMDTHA